MIISGPSRGRSTDGSYTPPSAGGNLIPLMLDGSHTYDAAAVSVSLVGGETYLASIPSGDAGGTLWWLGDEGRMDYATYTGDFDVRAYNVGLKSGSDVNDFQFCGLAAWIDPLDYEFAVAGNRGGTGQTIEYKSTVNGSSNQNDIGANAITGGQCDLRVVRVGSAVTFYWRQVGAGEGAWTSLPHSSFSRPTYGTGPVRVGLITYGYLTVSAFTGGCDMVEAVVGSPV